jgi:DNA-binding transcriptional ArsR family regulator
MRASVADTAGTDPAGASPPEASPPEASPPEASPPEAERMISDVETLKALSDPLRLKILETMGTRATDAWSAKELAATIGVPQTRLYHHLDVLLERDLIRVVGQRVVSGIIETRYRVAALSMRLDPKLLAGDGEAREGAGAVLSTVLDSARAELTIALRDAASRPGGTEAPDRPLVRRGMAMFTPARAAELRTRLDALIAEYDTDASDPAAESYGLLLALYRIPPMSGDAADD